MNLVTLITISVCGGLGAVLRFVLDTSIKRAISRMSPTIFPWSTLLINSLAVILFAAALVYVRDVNAQIYALATTGFLGGFSTFSTAMNEIITLARGKHWGEFFVYLLVAVGIPVLVMLAALMFFVSLHL